MFKQGKVWGSTQLVHKCDNFEAVEYSVVYEFYYARMDSNDIEREDHGGKA